MENIEVLESMHTQLEALQTQLEEIREQKCELKRENTVASSVVKGMNKSIANKEEGAKAVIRPLEEHPERVAIETNKKLKELVTKEKELLIQIDALEKGIAEAQEKLEFVED